MYIKIVDGFTKFLRVWFSIHFLHLVSVCTVSKRSAIRVTTGTYVSCFVVVAVFFKLER